MYASFRSLIRVNHIDCFAGRIKRTAALSFILIAFALNGLAATGTIQDVQHVVILILENRSFDHYLGSLSAVRGFGDPNALILDNGSPDLFQPESNSFVLPFPAPSRCLVDVYHDWSTSHQAWNWGKWDQWIPAKGTTAMAYYTRADLPFLYALADAYTVCDAYYCSVLGPTNPNRLYSISGTIDPNGTGGGPVLGNLVPTNGFTWTTYPEGLQAAGVTWKSYQQSSDYIPVNPLTWFAQYKNAQPGNPLYDRGIALVPDVVAAFQSDITNGTLPQVSWIIPRWSASEHPFLAAGNAAFFIEQLLNALTSTPAVYNSTVFVITYDENGGFFDHVPPPVPPTGTPDEFAHGLPIGLGARVPMILVSPWTRGGYVCSQVFDHTSILRFLETWTGVQEPNISPWRRQVCGDLTSAFDFLHPVTDVPILPDPLPINCTNGITPVPPSPQTLPVQEAGTRPARPLPYAPDASLFVDCSGQRVGITMTNAGTASVHLAIYANAFRADGPWQYDILPSSSLTDYFAVTNAQAAYDLSCYGPAGFLRHFVGNLNTNCNGIDVLFSLDSIAGGVRAALQNYTLSPVSFTLTNAAQPGVCCTDSVPAGMLLSSLFFPVTNASGFYDLNATASSDTNFLRSFSGQLDMTQPALAATLSTTNLLLTYPVWASSSFVVECTTNLAQGPWTQLATSPDSITNGALITLPLGSPSMYFRFRQ